MTTQLPAPAFRRRARCLAVSAAIVAALYASNVLAQSAAAPVSASGDQSTEQLDALVARIALYPDDLIAIILPASTNPLQLVQADRFLDKRKTDPKLPIDEGWDDAVKSLLNYPEVVKTMSADLNWTAALGEAVVDNQDGVMEAIQVYRRRAEAAGNLKSDAKQVVEVEKEVIKIVPANPEVIYVPQYNPTSMVVAGGYSSWGYWPAPYPVYYYPYAPGAALATGLIWGAAIGAAWNGGRYVTHYGGYGGNSNININRNTNINTGNINVGSGNVNRGNVNAGNTSWKSNKQPGQVSRSVGANSPPRVGDSRPSDGGFGGAGAGAGQGGGNLGSGAAGGRPSTLPAGGAGQGGNRGAGAGAGARPATVPSGAGQGAGAGSRPTQGGGAAMSGYGSGRQAQMDSSRGAASRGASTSGARSRPQGGGGGGGGGSRGGGGGGARGGGGGRR